MAHLWPTATLLLSCLHLCSSSNLDNATNHLALLAFKSMLSNDSIQSLSSWNDSIHFCEWPGVACGGPRHPQRVVSLVLRSLGLSGSIPPVIGNLTFLRVIDLSGNKLHGHIPLELARLFRLQQLNLSMNSLEGGIPETLSNCSRLQSISLRDNALTGGVPSGLSKCSDLQNINFAKNNLSGVIPPSFMNFSFLSVLSFGTNQLSGRIPSNIGNLYSLVALSLASNYLSGEIPSSVGKLSKLTILGFSRNQLTGEIPPSIWNLSSLSHLSFAYNNLSGSLPLSVGQALPLIESIDLYNNYIHGPIPTSLSNASLLEHIDMSFNRFTGPIPPVFGSLQNLQWLHLADNFLKANDSNGWNFLIDLTNCTSLQKLQLDSNNLGGVLPLAIANLSTELQLLTMQNNGISGTISPEIGNLISLQDLDLGPNLLTGSIPDSIGMIKNLHGLDLDGNKLSGEIPSSIGNLTQLISLFLDDNELNGSIPASLGNCQNLILLNFDSNRLTGDVPKDIFTISTLSRYLGLAFNSLTGSIPSEVGSLRNLQIFYLNDNRLSGEIPSALGECLELEQLEIRGNFFNGSIPSSLSALRGIVAVDLSQNNFSGKIPEFFQDFRFLFYLNLSFNSFQGAVPSHGVFANASAVSVLGNNELCGGNPEMQLPACPSQSLNKKHNSRSLILILIISIAILFVVLFLIFCFVSRCWIKKSSSNASKNVDSESLNGQERISYAELVRATSGFSPDSLIGTGSFARVYKGMLQGDNMKVVAVKVLNLQLKGASKSFIAECNALRNIRHRNLVKILTACSGINYQGNEFKAVVLDFMNNGSLDDWLHPKENEPVKKLNLVQRLNIAIDTASALDYLHHYIEKSIIHCDLKPSNVLLDDEMVAHVGDFGLARFLKKIASKSSQYSTSSIGLKGTIGYVPPEYGMGNRVSTKGDVYSYGILILEMFTGKRPTDDILTDGLSLQKFVEMALPERVTDVIDAQLLLLEDIDQTGDDQTMNGERAIYCITSALQIGLRCSNELPAQRLEMGVVIKELHKIRDVFTRDGNGVAQLHDEDKTNL